MELSERIKLLDQLGKFLINYCNNHATNKKDIFFSKLHTVLKKSQISNPYFEKANIIQSLSYWGETLNEKKSSTKASKTKPKVKKVSKK